MKVYTRRGDAGETDLFGGVRVPKHHRRVSAYGDVDELNASIGGAAAATADAGIRELLQGVQSALFDVGAQLATPDPARQEKSAIPTIAPEDVRQLELEIDRLETELAPLKNFILPGGTAASAALHLARAICRRAERSVVSLAAEESVGETTLCYLNRLSDLLFVLARVENRRAGVDDVPWTGRQR